MTITNFLLLSTLLITLVLVASAYAQVIYNDPTLPQIVIEKSKSLLSGVTSVTGDGCILASPTTGAVFLTLNQSCVNSTSLGNPINESTADGLYWRLDGTNDAEVSSNWDMDLFGMIASFFNATDEINVGEGAINLEISFDGTTNLFNTTGKNALFVDNVTMQNIIAKNICYSNGTGCLAEPVNLTNVAYINESQTFIKSNSFSNIFILPNNSINIPVTLFDGSSYSNRNFINFYDSSLGNYSQIYSLYDSSLGGTGRGLHLNSTDSIYSDVFHVLSGGAVIGRNNRFGLGLNPSVALSNPPDTDAYIVSTTSGTNKVNFSIVCDFKNGVGARGCDEMIFDTTKSSTIGVHFHTATRNDSLYIGGNGRVGIGTASPSTQLDVNGNLTIRGPFINLTNVPYKPSGIDTDYLCINNTSGEVFRNETGC